MQDLLGINLVSGRIGTGILRCNCKVIRVLVEGYTLVLRASPVTYHVYIVYVCVTLQRGEIASIFT